jgi:putative ABC transport system substrate-binding protein
VKRREFISLLGGATAAWPLAARAQQVMPLVGFIGSGSSGLADRLNAFRTGLSETGYVEGRNTAIKYRLAEGRNERLPALMDDLVRLPTTVIAAGGLPAVLAAKAATTTIPIAFYVRVDPVEMGIVASLNRPGGNLTGRFSSTRPIRMLEGKRESCMRPPALSGSTYMSSTPATRMTLERCSTASPE